MAMRAIVTGPSWRAHSLVDLSNPHKIRFLAGLYNLEPHRE